MLVLTRKLQDEIVIAMDDRVIATVKATAIQGKDTVKIGIEAPKDIQVHRSEVWERILREKGDNA